MERGLSELIHGEKACCEDFVRMRLFWSVLIEARRLPLPWDVAASRVLALVRNRNRWHANY